MRHRAPDDFLVERASGVDASRAKAAALALLEAPLAAHAQNRGRLEAAFRLAMVSGDVELCAKALGPFLKRPVWDARFLANRFVCLERARHPEAQTAREDFERYLVNTPGRFGDALNDAMTPEKLLAEVAPAATVVEAPPASTVRDALRR